MDYENDLWVQPCTGMVHVIKKGDTLYEIAKKYHISVSKIMYANPYVNVYNLQVGDELCIPVSIDKTADRTYN